jgi:hypothetical protein
MPDTLSNRFPNSLFTYNEILIIIKLYHRYLPIAHEKSVYRFSMVAQACNPSNLGSRDRRIEIWGQP